MNSMRPILALLTGTALFAVACGGGDAPEAPAPDESVAATPAPTPAAPGFDRALLGAFAPLPAVMSSASNPITDEKAALGRMLYHDERFSLDNDISCNSCHQLDHKYYSSLVDRSYDHRAPIHLHHNKSVLIYTPW